MTILSTIIGCLIANIIFMVIIGYVCYRFIDKNKRELKELKESLNNAFVELKNVDFDKMTASMNEAIEEINKTLDELKKITQ